MLSPKTSGGSYGATRSFCDRSPRGLDQTDPIVRTTFEPKDGMPGSQRLEPSTVASVWGSTVFVSLIKRGRLPVLSHMERRIWHPSADRWIIIDRDGSLIDAHRTGQGRISFHASSNQFDPRELERWMREHGHISDSLADL